MTSAPSVPASRFRPGSAAARSKSARRHLARRASAPPLRREERRPPMICGPGSQGCKPVAVDTASAAETAQSSATEAVASSARASRPRRPGSTALTPSFNSGRPTVPPGVDRARPPRRRTACGRRLLRRLSRRTSRVQNRCPAGATSAVDRAAQLRGCHPVPRRQRNRSPRPSCQG
jgi:hypothetical protein